MKIVIAIDSFKGSKTSMEAGNAAKAGILSVKPEVSVIVKPLADGGEGTTDAMIEGMHGEKITLTVTGPMKNPVSCYYGYLPKTKTAIIEMAAASGITLVPSKQKNPLLTECSFHIACDVKNPLYGENGATYIYGPQKGGTPDMLPILESGMRNFARVTAQMIKNNSSAEETDIDKLCDMLANKPGAGAAGGLGFAFSCFTPSELVPGIELILNTINFENDVKDADIVITGEGRLDHQTAMGKAPVGVAQIAKKYGAKVIAFAGSVTPDATACNAAGIDAFFPIVRGVTTLEEAMETENAKANLTAAVEQVFRLL